MDDIHEDTLFTPLQGTQMPHPRIRLDGLDGCSSAGQLLAMPVDFKVLNATLTCVKEQK
jgi:hypothetical protein